MTRRVNGGSEQPPIISVGKEYVYIRSNFEQVTDDEMGEHWQWDEEIVTLKEYITTMTDRNNELEDSIADLSIILAGVL